MKESLFLFLATGVLKGFDPLLNLVLDGTTEYLRGEIEISILVFETLQRFLSFFVLTPDPDDPFKLSDNTRPLGLVVCRGTSVVLVCPVDGMEAIANPFLQQE